MALSSIVMRGLSLLTLFVGGIQTQVVHAEAPRTVFFISDLHMGMGERVPGKFANQEDFRWDSEFGEWLQYIDASTTSNADLVILGDMFELWQSPFQECRGDGVKLTCMTTDCVVDPAAPNRGCTEEEALRRLRFVLVQHQATLDKICAFARKGANQVVVVPGNHDASLLLPSLADAVLNQCKPAAPRMTLAKSGFWLSPDKRIYADHGHVFDKVNSFPGWPIPYDTVQGRRIMQRPWGEAMVQQFFNQYEELLPVIDNMRTESQGARLAVEALGNAYAGDALSRFLRFLAFDTSLRQKLAFLGQQDYRDDVDQTLGPNAAAAAEWDAAAVRRTDATRFFIESMPFDALRVAAETAPPSISWSDVSDDDLLALCDQRRVLADFYARTNPSTDKRILLCPKKVGELPTLGYVADKILGLDLRNRRKHLTDMAIQVGHRFDIYVYGHTHIAAAPSLQKMNPLWQVSVVNTGAFQRLISLEELQGLAKEEHQPVTKTFAQLTPEGLPPCYSFVRINPYPAGASPKAELLAWAFVENKWTDLESCPAWP